jgi:predicted DNA-binding transcriptional regulator YafY
MRASRLLQMLLLLQNRGRLTCAQLSNELEVTRRTVLRDVDALTEAGLPVIVHRGPGGGIELGFHYRTRLTGLSVLEAEALAVLLSYPVPALDALGLSEAGRMARAKVFESLPDQVRQTVERARACFRFEGRTVKEDPRVAALADAIRGAKRVRIRATSLSPRTIHPVALVCHAGGWSVIDALTPDIPITLNACEDINVSALSFR